MTPYQLIQSKPFPRNRSIIENLFDAIGLNRFFLREGKRPHFRVDNKTLVSPTDSKLVEIQTLRASDSVKGKSTAVHTEWYSFEEIVHDDKDRQVFEGGAAYNFYLSPLNLHYCLFPADLTVTEITHHPHFCRPIVFMKSGEVHNERLVIRAQTSHDVPIIIILIGSFMVSGIECIADVGQFYRSADVLGGFKLGSTAMVLLPKGSTEPLVDAGTRLLLGEPFARLV